MKFRIPGINYVGDTATGSVIPDKVLGFDDVSADPSAGGGWDTWLTSLLNVLTSMRGASDRLMPLTGIAIPLITGVDTMEVISLITPHIVQALRRLTGLDGPLPHDKLDEDLKITIASGNAIYAQVSIKKGWVAYLSASPDPSDGSVRDGDSPGGFTTIGGKVADPQDLHNAVSLVKYWQTCIDQSVEAIHACGANGVGAQTQPDNMAAFFTAVQHLTTQLDLVREAAATSTSQVLKDGLVAAKDAFVGLAEDAANLGGEIAAKAANEAGKLAGNVASGFFSQIGAIGYAVTAIVIYLAFYR